MKAMQLDVLTIPLQGEQFWKMRLMLMNCGEDLCEQNSDGEERALCTSHRFSDNPGNTNKTRYPQKHHWEPLSAGPCHRSVGDKCTQAQMKFQIATLRLHWFEKRYQLKIILSPSYDFESFSRLSTWRLYAMSHSRLPRQSCSYVFELCSTKRVQQSAM